MVDIKIMSVLLMKVRLICGNESAIANVSEPRTCEYVLEFITPLACADMLLVYPTLSPEQRDEWDTLEALLLQNYVTGQVCHIV